MRRSFYEYPHHWSWINTENLKEQVWDRNRPYWSDSYEYFSWYSDNSTRHPHAYYNLDGPDEEDTLSEWPMTVTESMRDVVGNEEVKASRSGSESNLQHDQDVRPDYMSRR